MEPILKYFIAGGTRQNPRAQRIPFTHVGYKSEFVFGRLSKKGYPLEFCAWHKPCVSEPFIQQIEPSDCLTYWREIRNDLSMIRDLVMVVCDHAKSSAVEHYLENNQIMEAGDSSFKAIIRGFDSEVFDIGTASFKVFFVVVDKKKNQQNIGRRLTEVLNQRKKFKLPALEITLTSKERGVMICDSEEEREAAIESLNQNKDLDSWNGPFSLNGKSRTHVLDRFASYELALNWLSAYYVARGWLSQVRNIASPSEFQELNHICKIFAQKYTVQRLKKIPMFDQDTVESVIGKQVDKLLNGEDIALLKSDAAG
jgi:hypothetical protein